MDTYLSRSPAFSCIITVCQNNEIEWDLRGASCRLRLCREMTLFPFLLAIAIRRAWRLTLFVVSLTFSSRVRSRFETINCHICTSERTRAEWKEAQKPERRAPKAFVLSFSFHGTIVVIVSRATRYFSLWLPLRNRLIRACWRTWLRGGLCVTRKINFLQ